MKIHQEICGASQTIIQTNFGRECIQKQNPIKWDPECQKTFDKLKESCTTTPILAFADFKKPFKLHMDVSVLGLGAVLYWVQDGVER